MQLSAPREQLKTTKTEDSDRGSAVTKIAQIGCQVTKVLRELSASLGFSEEGAMRGHCKACNNLKDTVGQLRSGVATAFQTKAMRMKLQLILAAHQIVHDVTTHSQGEQKNVMRKYSEALEIAVMAVDEAFEEPVSEIGVTS